MKRMIKNGLLVDGSGAPGLCTDILIEDQRIRAIECSSMEADEVIDAQGKVVCPGFIDTHIHPTMMIIFEMNTDLSDVTTLGGLKRRMIDAAG